MSRTDQYRVTHQPEKFDDKNDAYVPTISQADLSPKSRNRGTSSSSCMEQIGNALSIYLCCVCLRSMCESNPDACGECDCSGCDC